MRYGIYLVILVVAFIGIMIWAIGGKRDTRNRGLGEVLGITIHDRLVISRKRHASFRRLGLP